MADVLRLIDANANRAREAMRVLEDAARFLLDDAELSNRFKALRHDLAAALNGIGGIELHRDTPGDVGTASSTEAERRRGTTADVAIAAGKRLSESLRCLEEYGKLIGADLAAAVEQLRYRGYELETRLHRRLGSRAVRQWRLCVIVTESLCTHHAWLDVAAAAIDAGADCIQLREKELTDAELLERARRLVRLAGDRAAVIVNDRPDIALLAGAAGVHLGEHDLPVEEARKLTGRRLLIGASTHDLSEARRAVEAGADYCGVGAMFPTTTKPRQPAGLEYLRQFLDRYPSTPHLAIGGINPQTVTEVVEAGARGVAVSSCVCGAQDPAAIVRQLLAAIPADRCEPTTG